MKIKSLFYRVLLIAGLLNPLFLTGQILSNKTDSIVTDIDGNVYHTVTIGTKVWMVENLKTTRYRNGDSITNVTDAASWIALTNGAYCWYNNDSVTHKTVYGALYNWYAASDKRNIAPIGWHVPTDTEWTALTISLGGDTIAGGKLKVNGTAHWANPNTGATNSSGFKALPGGYRYGIDGSFSSLTNDGYWWSTSTLDSSAAWYRNLYFENTKIDRDNNYVQYGYSIRCVRD